MLVLVMMDILRLTGNCEGEIIRARVDLELDNLEPKLVVVRRWHSRECVLISRLRDPRQPRLLAISLNSERFPGEIQTLLISGLDKVNIMNDVVESAE